MRKLIISILLASAAASPVIAQDHGRWHQDQPQPASEQSQQERDQAREQRRQERQQIREERSNGGANAERLQQVQQQQAQQQAAQQQAAQQQQQAQQQQAARELEIRQRSEQRSGWDRSRSQRGRNDLPPEVVQQRQQRDYRGYRGGYAGAPEQGRQTSGTGGWSRDRGNWSQSRDGDRRERYRDSSRWANGGWDRDWRNDRRYDWRRYRDHHRSSFHVGIYYDPFGYGYRPFDIGYNLAPLYYRQQYWIDPSLYSLPFPPPGTAWVRYWNDAVLVDLYSGQVVDVIHNFFW